MIKSQSEGAGDVLRATQLSRTALVEIFSGRVTMVQVDQVFTEEECSRAVTEITSSGTTEYDRNLVFPPIAKLGPAINEYQAASSLPNSYWDEAERAEKFWKGSPWSAGIRSRALTAVSEAWGAPVRRIQNRGHLLYTGMIREINNGTHIHFDDAVHERPDLFAPTELITQVAMNVFLSVPRVGGETHVWRHRRQGLDEEMRIGYGYQDSVVAGAESAQVTPRLGEIVLLGSRWFHRVARSSQGRRITLCFCLGITADGQIVTWS